MNNLVALETAKRKLRLRISILEWVGTRLTHVSQRITENTDKIIKLLAD